MCPEILDSYYYTIKGDVYSLGVTLFMMLTNEVPFYDTNLGNLKIKKR